MGVVVLLIIALISGGLYFWKMSRESALADLDAQLLALEASRNREAESSLLTLNDQIGTLSRLMDGHTYWSAGLSTIESLLQSEVQIASFNATRGEFNVTIKALNLTAIARQVASFTANEEITDIQLSEVNVLTDGGIQANMRIFFDVNKFLKP